MQIDCRLPLTEAMVQLIVEASAKERVEEARKAGLDTDWPQAASLAVSKAFSVFLTIEIQM